MADPGNGIREIRAAPPARHAHRQTSLRRVVQTPLHSHGYAQTVVANKVASHSYGEVKLNDMILWGSYCYSACSCIAE